ncbi:hypothetical protein [Diaminobutyricimonas sp. TR449]|uniref:hypothetical protein n=1 Tax=Diaminobutyricimonas sp. TR449 TaxID=2708076 RepID=UPI00141E0E95|nr:hypothetical protein [Diaminobutyricimonas sp. TR449]
MATGDRNERDVAALKFDGGRFNAQGFPLDGIDELEKYQRLVLEAAKKIWWEQHPTAKRLPRNFADRVRLRLTTVDRGSVIPVLEREPKLAVEQADLLEMSIEYVDLMFESMVSRLTFPDDIPDAMAKQAKLFGVRLAHDEKAIFRDGTASPISYTADRRKTFLRAIASETKVMSGTLIGTVRMLDAAQQFIFLDAQGRAIKGEFSKPAIFEELHEVHGLSEQADLVWIDCHYQLDERTGLPGRINEVSRAGLFAKSSNIWARQLAEFAALPEGWLDGEGERIELTPLAAALEMLDLVTHLALHEPSIFPDLDGGVRLEWLTGASHTVLTVNDEPFFSGYHLNIETGEEQFSDEMRGKGAALEFVRGWL